MDRKLETGHILQIGPTNWQEEVTIPEGLNWHYFSIQPPLQIEDYMTEQGIKQFQALVLDHPERLLSFKEELGLFQPYTVFYDEVYDQESVTEELDYLMQLVQAKAWDFSDKAPFLYQLHRFLYDGQYGDAFSVRELRVRADFAGSQTVRGKHFLELEGSYGEEYTPIAQWINTYSYDGVFPRDLWLEYEKTPDCQIQLRVQFFQSGTLGSLVKELVYSEADLERPVLIDEPDRYYLSFSLEAKGQGRLIIGALHKRFSHGPFGEIALGSQTLRDSKRQEIFAYFHPGDLKPPLNVYFSGYRPAEGFEGFSMMKNM